MNYLEVLKAQYEAKNHGVKTLRTDTTILFSPEYITIQDGKGRKYQYKPKETLRFKGEYKLLLLVGVIRAYILRSVLTS